MAYEYHHRRMVQFIDTDMAGLIHYTNYFRYFEEAEFAFLGSLGVPDGQDPGRVHNLPRVSVGAEFLKAVTFRDVLDVHLWVESVGRSSIGFAGSFRCEGEEVARVRLKAVWVKRDDDGKIRSAPLPEALRGALEVAPFARPETR